MAIPTTLNTQISLSKLDREITPHVTFLKGTMWIIYARNRRIIVKEHQGARALDDFISDETLYFTISGALTNLGAVSTTKFWLWTVEVNNNLYCTDVEPVPGFLPIIGTKVLIDTSVSVVSVNVFQNNAIRVMSVDGSADIGTSVKLVLYPSLGSAPSQTFYLNWTPDRLTNALDLYTTDYSSVQTKFLVSYLATGSPPNVWQEEYLQVLPPTINLFTVTPNTAEGSTLLTFDWDVSNVLLGNPGHSLEINQGIGAITPIIGSLPNQGPFSVTTIFTLTATNPAGTDTAQAIFTVLDFLNVKDSCVDSFGNVWVATPEGVKKIAFGSMVVTTYTVISTGGDLPSDDITCIHVGDDDVIWAGTRDAGIVSYDQLQVLWTKYNTGNTLNFVSDNISDISSDTTSKGVWVGTTNAGLMFLDFRNADVPITVYDVNNSIFKSNIIHSISQGVNSILVGTEVGAYYCNLYDSRYLRVAKNSTLKVDEFRIYGEVKNLAEYSAFVRELMR